MIVITTHTNADFDALASMVAASLLYPGARLVFSGAAEPLVRRWLEENRDRLPEIQPLKGLDHDQVERLVCVDVSSGERLGPLVELLRRTPPTPTEVFDHHPGAGDLKGERHVVEEAGACTTVMVKCLLEAGIEPTPFEATLFLLAIYEDTGFLSFPTTRPSDFGAVLQCLDWGGELRAVQQTLHRGFTEAQMRLLAAMFEHLEAVAVGGVTVHLTTLALDDYVPDLSVLVHEILAMEGMQAIFLLAYLENRVHIIARSRTPHVNAAQVLSVFGGGGHPSAASAVIRDKTPAEVKALLLDELTFVHPAGLRASDIMTREYHRLEATATTREAFREMNRHRVNALPVLREGRLVGVVTRQEVDGALQHGLAERPISDFLISPPPFFPPEVAAEEVRRLMLENNWRIALFGRDLDHVEGLVSRMSLFKSLYHQDKTLMVHRSGGQPSAKEIGHLMRGAFPPEELGRLKSLGALAEAAGTPCLLVGGAVRDLLLGRPVQDVDFVVEGDAVELAEAWARREGGRIRAHRAFGTALWIRPGGSHWDFATARAEYYETPAALPTVAHAALYQDLYRRDFTINTLALYLTPERFGEVLDLFGGVRDLKAGRIRVLHGLSFVEDPTRAFRAVRFSVRLGFTLPTETEQLIEATRKQQLFRHLSPKRVLAEVRQILAGPNAVEGLKAMETYRLLEVFWPALKLTPKVLETLYRVQQALGFFDTQFPDEPMDRPCVYLMALTERLSNAELATFRDHYPFSQQTRDALARYRSLTWHAIRALTSEEDCGRSFTYKALKGQPLPWVLFLLAKIHPPSRQARVRDFLVKDRFLKLAISGHDLIRAGIPPSPAISRALEETRAAKADGRLQNRSEELAFALEAARRALEES
ncbi:MAG: CBS domain-containing protein [Acidobacteriota bacterium]